MKCSVSNEQLMDYLFSEADDQEIRRIEGHLKKCQRCSAELKDLRQTVDVMEKWPEIEPRHRVVFESDEVGLAQRLRGFLGLPERLSPALRWGLRGAVALTFLVLVFARVDVTVGDGRFVMSVGRDQAPLNAETAVSLAAALKESQEENYFLTRQMLQESENRQRQLLLTGLADLSDKIDNRRLADLRYMGENLDRMHRNTEYNFDRTNSLLQNLVQVTGSEIRGRQ